MSVTSRLHGATFQNINVRGPTPRGTSYCASFFFFASCLFCPLHCTWPLFYRSNIAFHFQPLFQHAYGVGDSTDMVYTTSKHTRSSKRYWSDKIMSVGQLLLYISSDSAFIHSFLRQVHSLFQSKFSTECDRVLRLSTFCILPFLKVIQYLRFSQVRGSSHWGDLGVDG